MEWIVKITRGVSSTNILSIQFEADGPKFKGDCCSNLMLEAWLADWFQLQGLNIDPSTPGSLIGNTKIHLWMVRSQLCVAP